MRQIALQSFILILLVLASASAQRELNVQVFPSETTSVDPARFRPGLFYFQYYDPEAVSIFRYVSTPGMYNSLREIKFYSECWRWSTSREDLLQRMTDTGLRDVLRSLSTYTDRIVVKFNGMPYWLSSSSSMDVLGDKSWREFMTHPPHDWDAWGDAVQAAVSVIASWGIHPYYEIWNEPDGEYWKGSDEDLLELYRRAALAVRRADPLAKVGGPGMHTWWRSADPANASAQQPYMGALFGHKPEQLPERYSVLYRLLDSVRGNWADQQVPLDFISFHHFNHNRKELGRTAQQLRAKMRALGFCPPGEACPSGTPFPELYISEWQTTYGAQEQLFQPSLFLSLIREMEAADITFHSISALADFGTDADDEFIWDWGLLSGNHLVKPVYRALQLLDDVLQNGEGVRVESGEMASWASLSSDTLRLLVAHYSMPPIWYSQYPKVGWSAFERLLYDADRNLTQYDYRAAGHTSLYWGYSDWGSIDRIFRGVIPPTGSSPEMIDALREAREQYVADSIANAGPHSLRIRLSGVRDTVRGSLIRIDSTRNNIIFLYDSLRTAGFSHQRAVDSLHSCSFRGGCYGTQWEKEDVVFIDGETTLAIDPNTVCYLQLAGVQTPSGVERPTVDAYEITVFPNPSTDRFSYALKPWAEDARVSLYDIHGRIVRQHDGAEGMIDCRGLSPGMYLLVGQSGEGTLLSRRVVIGW